MRLQSDFKDLERDNQESQQVNQSQLEKIEALDKMNKELGNNLNEQKLHFDEKLQFYQAMVNGNADEYWLSKRSNLEK